MGSLIAGIIVVAVIALWLSKRQNRRDGLSLPDGADAPPLKAPIQSSRATAATVSPVAELGLDLDDERESFWIGKQLFFETSRSPNGRFLVGASDHHFEGEGREVKGGCALMEGKKLLFKKTIRRANHPHVTDEGLVLVQDWKDDGKLNGALLAFDLTGELRWRRDFNANLFGSGVSRDGARAFVSTCNSDSPSHSGKTFLLDTKTGETIWVRDGWGDARFAGNALGVELTLADGTTAFFPFDGEGGLGDDYMRARRQLQEAKERGQYWAVLPKVDLALKERPPNVTEAVRLLTELDGKEKDLPPSAHAKLLRYRGDVAEAQGKLEVAVSQWEAAFAIDPKVGVKRKLEKLRLAASGSSKTSRN